MVIDKDGDLLNGTEESLTLDSGSQKEIGVTLNDGSYYIGFSSVGDYPEEITFQIRKPSDDDYSAIEYTITNNPYQYTNGTAIEINNGVIVSDLLPALIPELPEYTNLNYKFSFKDSKEGNFQNDLITALETYFDLNGDNQYINLLNQGAMDSYNVTINLPPNCDCIKLQFAGNGYAVTTSNELELGEEQLFIETDRGVTRTITSNTKQKML